MNVKWIIFGVTHTKKSNPIWVTYLARKNEVEFSNQNQNLLSNKKPYHNSHKVSFFSFVYQFKIFVNPQDL